MLDEERSCRYDDELDHQPTGDRTMSFVEAWLLAAARKSLNEGAANNTQPNLVNVYIQVKGGFEDIAGFQAANDEFTIGCTDTAEALSTHFADRKMDPAVIEGFHMVRKHYADPRQHVPAEMIKEHI